MELLDQPLFACSLAALLAVQAEKPNVLVSDIGMPEIDGYELLQRIRALGEAEGGKRHRDGAYDRVRTKDAEYLESQWATSGQNGYRGANPS